MTTDPLEDRRQQVPQKVPRVTRSSTLLLPTQRLVKRLLVTTALKTLVATKIVIARPTKARRARGFVAREGAPKVLARRKRVG